MRRRTFATGCLRLVHDKRMRCARSLRHTSVPSSVLGDDEVQRGVLRVFQSRSETRAFYNKISKVYDLLAEHTEAPMRQLGLETLAPRRDETILEIGFGTGHCLVALADAVALNGSVHGIDLSDGMARIAHELVTRRHLFDRVRVVCGNAEWLPYRSASMDAVFMSFTLELFDTPVIPRVLAECQRVLRRNGRIGVVGMSKEGSPGLVLEAFQWTHRHFPNLLDCRPIFVRRALTAAGFRFVAARGERMWVPVEIVMGVSE